MDKLQADKLTEIKRPTCPNCGKEMKRYRYTGYYDSFDYWNCDCDYEPVPDRECKGEYA